MKRKKLRRLRKPIYKKRIFWFLLCLPFLLGFLFWFFFFSNFFTIKTVSLPEGEEKDQIENLVSEMLKNNFFKRGHFFFVNSKKLETQILNRFPEIKLIKVLKKFPDTLSIHFEKRSPLFLFCDSECYLMDDEGIIFKERRDENLVEIRREGEGELKIGKKVLMRDEIDKILKILRELENLKIVCEKVFISEDKVEFLTRGGMKVIFIFEKDIDFQIKKMKIAWESLEEQKKKNLEYLDLRFGNFAIPKYKITQ